MNLRNLPNKLESHTTEAEHNLEAAEKKLCKLGQPARVKDSKERQRRNLMNVIQYWQGVIFGININKDWS